MKCRGISLFALALVLVLAISCGKKARPIPGRMYSGVFFSEPYQIDVVGDSTNYGHAIDSILLAYEHAFNIADPKSIISQYNAFKLTDSAFTFVDSTRAFGVVYELARDLNHKTLQFYDPTSNPLKREWMKVNFFKNRTEPNLDSLYEFVGFDGAKMDLNEVEGEHHEYIKSQIRKADPRIEADFTPLASAYALDKVADYLRERKVPQFRITHGHRVICNGTSVDSLNIASLGITGAADDQKFRMFNRAFSYKTWTDKTQMVDVTYGYPVENEFVYVGVSAKTLAESEVFSEAFMVMGFEAAGKWYEENEDSDVQSFMLIKRGEEMTSASTTGFDIMLITPDSLKQGEPAQ